MPVSQREMRLIMIKLAIEPCNRTVTGGAIRTQLTIVWL